MSWNNCLIKLWERWLIIYFSAWLVTRSSDAASNMLSTSCTVLDWGSETSWFVSWCQKHSTAFLQSHLINKLPFFLLLLALPDDFWLFLRWAVAPLLLQPRVLDTLFEIASGWALPSTTLHLTNSRWVFLSNHTAHFLKKGYWGGKKITTRS